MSPFFFLNQSAIRKVNELFSLPAPGKEQDWEIEMADASRRSEFFDVLRSNALTDDPDVHAAVAALFIASADEAITAEQFSDAEDDAAARYCRDNPVLREKMWRLWFQSSEPDNSDQIRRWLIPEGPASRQPR